MRWSCWASSFASPLDWLNAPGTQSGQPTILDQVSVPGYTCRRAYYNLTDNVVCLLDVFPFQTTLCSMWYNSIWLYVLLYNICYSNIGAPSFGQFQFFELLFSQFAIWALWFLFILSHCRMKENRILCERKAFMNPCLLCITELRGDSLIGEWV